MGNLTSAPMLSYQIKRLVVILNSTILFMQEDEVEVVIMDLYMSDSKDGILGYLRSISRKPKTYAASLGLSLLILVPYFHLGVLYSVWNTNKKPVDKSACECPCWDTLFKGSYENGAHPGYKHIYFNLTHQTFKIWALSATAFVLFYEAVKRLCMLVLNMEARWSMVILFGSVVYPHYYGWWMYFNAWNDDFYKQWYHQAFFSLTELASTLVVFYYCDNRRLLKSRSLLFVINIAVLHILASGGDQFISNVIFRKGAWYQYTRDVGFMVPDLLHITIPALELARIMRQKKMAFWEVVTGVDILLSLAGISILWILVANL